MKKIYFFHTFFNVYREMDQNGIEHKIVDFVFFFLLFSTVFNKEKHHTNPFLQRTFFPWFFRISSLSQNILYKFKKVKKKEKKETVRDAATESKIIKKWLHFEFSNYMNNKRRKKKLFIGYCPRAFVRTFTQNK